MNRRTLLKSTIASLAALVTLKPQKLFANVRKPDSNHCRIVVFGSDGLRIETAQQLRAAGAPGLSALNSPICALSGGALSVTQPEWASVWTGLPSYLHKAFDNPDYGAMPDGYHIMTKLMEMYAGEDFFPVWITGKGDNIKGNIPDSPHYQVYEPIVIQGHQGVYHGDVGRYNSEVHGLARTALEEAVLHQHFCCFIHFRDPDFTGHVRKQYFSYAQRAEEVDDYIHQLMQILPPDTDIIYCSDHGFNFKGLGEVEDGHTYAPKGMLATNFTQTLHKFVTRQSVGRMIYARAGGDPDNVPSNRPYAMYGINL